MVTLRKAFAAVVLLLIANSLWAQVSHAVPGLAYGPAVFTRHSRETTTATASFPEAQLVYGPYSLFIAAPLHAGVVVQLNGATVFGDGVREFPFPPHTVTLQADNTLNITLPDRVGESVIITILGYQYEYTEAYRKLPLVSVTPGPDDVDWRTKGVVTNVKDEGSCQSDWAFSATGATEGFDMIRTGQLISLSEQDLIDCEPRRIKNCANGNPAEALTYIAQNGDQSESEYPYTAVVGTCKAGTPYHASFTTVYRIPAGDEAALVAAVNQHPVSVVLNSNWFSGYTSGVANPDCSASPPTFTAALIVGYASLDETPFWIVKTSLGTSWGESGYFKIVRGQNACGIADFALQTQ